MAIQQLLLNTLTNKILSILTASPLRASSHLHRVRGCQCSVRRKDKGFRKVPSRSLRCSSYCTLLPTRVEQPSEGKQCHRDAALFHISLCVAFKVGVVEDWRKNKWSNVPVLTESLSFRGCNAALRQFNCLEWNQL